MMWKHVVLNEMQGQLQRRDIYYWRNKRGNEIDFVLTNHHKDEPIAIECKWRAKKFDPKNLKIFRNQYPKGRNFVVAQDVSIPFKKDFINFALSL